MIYVVIGQSGAGKTTFVRQRFLMGPATIKKDIVFYTECAEFILLGKYGIGQRTEGTDTLALNALPKIINQVERLRGQKKHIVLEGDRINNRRMFRYLAATGEGIRLFLLSCLLKTSMQRLGTAGSSITESFVKATKTKSRLNFLEWGKRFSGEVVITDD